MREGLKADRGGYVMSWRRRDHLRSLPAYESSGYEARRATEPISGGEAGNWASAQNNFSVGEVARNGVKEFGNKEENAGNLLKTLVSFPINE